MEPGVGAAFVWGLRLGAAFVVGLGAGLLIGRKYGWGMLAKFLFWEGYTILYDDAELHGEGRFRIVHAQKPPF